MCVIFPCLYRHSIDGGLRFGGASMVRFRTGRPNPTTDPVPEHSHSSPLTASRGRLFSFPFLSLFPFGRKLGCALSLKKSIRADFLVRATLSVPLPPSVSPTSACIAPPVMHTVYKYRLFPCQAPTFTQRNNVHKLSIP